MPPSKSPDSEPKKRACWECMRRRRICDSSRPACNKCVASKIVCPGYDDKKPLQWLAPGNVLSRPRKDKKHPPKRFVVVAASGPSLKGKKTSSSESPSDYATEAPLGSTDLAVPDQVGGIDWIPELAYISMVSPAPSTWYYWNDDSTEIYQALHYCKFLNTQLISNGGLVVDIRAALQIMMRSLGV